MGKKNKKWKKKNKNKYTSIIYSYSNNDVEATSSQVNQIAYQVFGSLYYTSDNS